MYPIFRGLLAVFAAVALDGAFVALVAVYGGHTIWYWAQGILATLLAFFMFMVSGTGFTGFILDESRVVRYVFLCVGIIGGIACGAVFYIAWIPVFRVISAYVGLIDTLIELVAPHVVWLADWMPFLVFVKVLKYVSIAYVTLLAYLIWKGDEEDSR